MTNRDDEKLDDLLRSWARQHEESRGGLDDLTAQIRVRLKTEEKAVPANRERRRSVIGPRAMWWGVAAASLLIVLGAALLRSNFTNEKIAVRPDTGTVSPEELALISEQDVQDKRLMAEELQIVFPNEFAWAMESGPTTKLGFRSSGGADSDQVIVVRFVLISRSSDDRKWNKLRTLDVLAKNEEFVELEAATNDLPSVLLWTHALADGMISIDAELELSDQVPIRMSSSRIQPAGSPAEIWRSTHGLVEYRLYQSAQVLANKKVG